MTENPYEAPQTESQPLPIASEVQLEQVSARMLAEFAGKMVLAIRISLVVWIAAILLAGTTWLYYIPHSNPIWVTVVMLNCSTVAIVLIVWGMVEAFAACNHFKRQLQESSHQKIVQRCGNSYALLGVIFYCLLPLIFEVLRTSDIQFLIFLVVVWISATLLQTYSHAAVIPFLRSFAPPTVWKPETQILQFSRWCGTISCSMFLAVMTIEFLRGFNGWAWLLLSLASLGSCLIPTCRAYRQLAREFGKL